MKLVCPSCGATHSADAWFTDAMIRQSLKIVAELPQGISKQVFPYLSLFRPLKKSLAWKRVLSLLGEIQELTSPGTLSWKNQAPRPVDARIWTLALEKTIQNPPPRLPLKSHGWLTSIAYEIADEMDKKSEQRNNREIISGDARSDRDPSKPALINGLTLDRMKEIRNKNQKSQ